MEKLVQAETTEQQPTLKKSEAINAVRMSAHHDTGDDRRIVHCFLGFIGADWDADEACHLIDRADSVGWTDGLFGLGLLVKADGRAYYFDTVKPVTS